MAQKEQRLKSAGVITLEKPGAWTPAGRKGVAKWLRRQAHLLERYGVEYSKTGNFRSRYLYEEKP